jgi:hypothetical protein
VSINGGAARVVCTDLDLDGITIHLIDSVLQPPAAAAGAAGSSVPGSSVPGASGFDAEQRGVADTWERALDSSLAYEDHAAVIEDPASLQTTIENYPTAAELVGGITVTVTAVTIEGDTATVQYVVNFAGVEAPYGELTTSLTRVDGAWIVPQAEYCAVQTMARNDCAA